MEFLVRSEVTRPPDLGPTERISLRDAETRRARDLKAGGTIVRVWRIPGRTATVGIWEAPDATALHEAIASLPMFGYMTIEVQALAEHPVDI